MDKRIIFKAPVPSPSGGYRLRYRIEGSSAAYVTITGAGTAITYNGQSRLYLNIPNLADDTNYEYLLDSNCGNGNYSSPSSGTFNTWTTSIVQLNVTLGGGGTAVIKNTSTNEEYSIVAVDTIGTTQVPIGEYEILSVSVSCSSPLVKNVTPIEGTIFTLTGSQTETYEISVNCI